MLSRREKRTSNWKGNFQLRVYLLHTWNFDEQLRQWMSSMISFCRHISTGRSTYWSPGWRICICSVFNSFYRSTQQNTQYRDVVRCRVKLHSALETKACQTRESFPRAQWKSVASCMGSAMNQWGAHLHVWTFSHRGGSCSPARISVNKVQTSLFSFKRFLQHGWKGITPVHMWLFGCTMYVKWKLHKNWKPGSVGNRFITLEN